MHATDESGNKSDVAVGDVQSTEGKFGKAVKFSGKATQRAGGSADVTARIEHQWAEAIPLHVRVMVLADKTLFIAGPPDVIDEEEAFDGDGEAQIQAQLEEQDSSLRGEKGALLWAVSVSDGTKLADYKLDSLPAWDGMAATAGRLYLSTRDGRVLCCWGGE